MTWIKSYSGLRVDVFDPKPDQIRLEDIAHALSNVCRFSGHCNTFYSVAEHSVRLLRACRMEMMPLVKNPFNLKPLLINALMHDAAEAYIGDITSPMKESIFVGSGGGQSFKTIKAYEDQLMRVIAKALRFEWMDSNSEGGGIIKRFDKLMLSTEAFHLLGVNHQDWSRIKDTPPDESPFEPISPEEAKAQFMYEAIGLGIKKFTRRIQPVQGA